MSEVPWRVGLNGVHAGASRETVVGSLAGRARGRSSLRRGSEYLHRRVRVRWVAAFCILGVQEQLGAEVTSWWRVRRTPGVSDEAALFAQNSALLDALEADPADDR